MQPGPDRLLVEFTPALAQARLDKRRAGLRGNIIGLVIVVVLVGAVMYYNRATEPWNERTTQVWIGVLVGLAVGQLAVGIVRWMLARRRVRRLPAGLALVVSRDGIATEQYSWPWAAVRSFRTRRRPAGGAKYEITADGLTSPVSFTVEDLSTFPATIDSAVRIYSDDACSVDLSGIDR